MRTRHLNGLLILAILIISTAPLYAQRQQQNVAKLKADAQKVFSSVSGDRAKIQAYCEIADLGGQLVEAAQEKDEKKTDALMKRIDKLEKILGPEYPALFNHLYEADQNSKDVQDICQCSLGYSTSFVRINSLQASPTKCGENVAVASWANNRQYAFTAIAAPCADIRGAASISLVGAYPHKPRQTVPVAIRLSAHWAKAAILLN